MSMERNPQREPGRVGGRTVETHRPAHPAENDRAMRSPIHTPRDERKDTPDGEQGPDDPGETA